VANTTKKAPQSAAEPSTFDVDGFVSGFKPALVSAKLHKRGDLIPVLSDLLARREKLKDEDASVVERSFAESDPLAEVEAEYNRVQAEFEAGGFEEFLFRPMTGSLEKKLINNHLASPHKDDDEWLTWRAMSGTCVSHEGIPMTAWPQLRDHVGEIAFAPLVRAFTDAYAGGGVTAPFLPLPSPTPGTEIQYPGSVRPATSVTPHLHCGGGGTGIPVTPSCSLKPSAGLKIPCVRAAVIPVSSPMTSMRTPSISSWNQSRVLGVSRGRLPRRSRRTMSGPVLKRL